MNQKLLKRIKILVLFVERYKYILYFDTVQEIPEWYEPHGKRLLLGKEDTQNFRDHIENYDVFVCLPESMNYEENTYGTDWFK